MRVFFFFLSFEKNMFPVSGNMPFSIFWLVSGRDVNFFRLQYGLSYINVAMLMLLEFIVY